MATQERASQQAGTSTHAGATGRRNMQFDEEYYETVHSGDGLGGTSTRTIGEQCRGTKRSTAHEAQYREAKQPRFQCDAAAGATTLAKRPPHGTEAASPTLETHHTKQQCQKRPRQGAANAGFACSQHSGQQLAHCCITSRNYQTAKNSQQGLLPMSRQHHACTGAPQPLCSTVPWLQQYAQTRHFSSSC